MTDNHDAFPKPTRRPDFIKVASTGEQIPSQAEQAAVGDKFTDFLQDILQANSNKVRNPDTSQSSPTGKLALKKPAPQLDGRWHIEATVNPSAGNSMFAPLPEQSIVLVFFDNSGEEREQFIYKRGEDGDVRREDYPDALEEEFSTLETGSIYDIPVTEQEKRDHMVKAMINGELPDPVSIPVGLEEFEGLAAFVTASDVTPY